MLDLTMKKNLIIMLLIFINNCGNTIVINKTIESRHDGLLLRCKLNKIDIERRKTDYSRIKGILYVINESNVEKKLNLRGVSLSIKDQICLIDDKWKQLLFEFKIGIKQTLQYEIYTTYHGTIKNNENFNIEIIWP